MKRLLPYVSLMFISFCAISEVSINHLNYKVLQLPKEEINLSESISEKGFQSDLVILKYAIQKAYGAKGVIEEDTFNKVNEALKRIKFTSHPEEMCQKIGKALSIFPDHHLHVEYNDKQCFERKLKLTNVGENLNDTQKNWKGIKTKNGIYTIAISEMPSGEWPGYHEFVKEALQNAKAIIIDLRRNGGGDTTQGMWLAKMLAAQKVETPYGFGVARQTPEALIIWDNVLQRLKRNSHDKQMNAQLNVYIQKNKTLLNKALAGQLEENLVSKYQGTDWTYDRSIGFQGPIYILQDKWTASSGENTIDYFEYFPNVVKVGSPTSGTVSFSNVALFILPNSGINVYMPTGAMGYKDGRFIEFIGIKPDITLDEGQDAYEYVLRLLRKDKLSG